MASAPSKRVDLPVSFRFATEEDFKALCEIINLAYEVETGSTGVAFKTRERLFTKEHFDGISRHINAGEVLVESDSLGEIVGCVVFYKDKADDSAMRFGPFAVRPGQQGRGYGALLLEKLEDEVLRQGRSALTMEIVNLRTDLPLFYLKHGFR